MKNEAGYWITLAHLPWWNFAKINNLIVKFFHDEKITIEQFFNLSESALSNQYQLNLNDISDLQKAKSSLLDNDILAKNLFSQDYELIPITSSEYSKTMKKNLKRTHSPPLLYTKGNKQLLHKKSIAVVGSRKPTSISLAFTDNLCKSASKNNKTVISGFAKGIDRQALDSTLQHKGQSIIVLPQGITTFTYGFKMYNEQILNGNILVLSAFPPHSDWSIGLAMARNSIIYGLSDEIYVAESNNKGGTWSGAIDGLKKGRKIYIRKPESPETNGNALLIHKGATPVDFNGIEILI